MSNYDKSIHANPSAQAWAKFFIGTLRERNLSMQDIDEDLMTGWFANAMMAMHDHLVKDCANFARQHNLNNAERSYMIHRAIKDHYGLVIDPSESNQVVSSTPSAKPDTESQANI